MAPVIKNTMFGKYFKHVLVLTLLAGIAYPLPQVKEAMAGAFAFGGETSVAAAVIPVMKNQAVVTDIKAKVSYDSGHKESNLVVTSSVKITAGASDITLPGAGSFPVNLYNKTLKLQGPTLSLSVVSSNLKKNSTGVYVIKKGTVASFTTAGQVNPAAMIAGQYEASVVAVVTEGGKLPVSTNKSKPVTVVGEASPFITIAGKGIYGTANKVSVNGVRLGKDIKVTIQNDTYSKTFSVSLKEKATQFSFNLADYAVPPGSYSMFVTNTKLGDTAGRSNNVGFTVLNQSKVIIAKVTPGTLALSFDSAKKESLLSAPFSIKLKAANDDLAFNDASFYVVAQNEIGNQTPASVVIKSISSVNGTSTPAQPFILKAGSEATFNIVSGVNPQTLFAGPYTMSVIGLYPATQGTTSPIAIQVQENKTNAVVIIGESSPYITAVNSPVAVGKTVMISGLRMNGAQIFIDGEVLANVIVKGSLDGTSLSFDLPTTTTNGFHQLSVKSDAYGASNTVYFESTGGVDVPPVVVCPAGYVCEPTNPTTPQIPDCPKGYTCSPVVVVPPTTGDCYVFNYNLTVGNTGADVVALQTFLISRGFNIPDVMSGQTAKGYYGDTTKAAVIAYQTSIGQPATGFVGPLTRAAMNSSCNTNPVVVCPVGFVCTPGTSNEPQPVNCPIGYICTNPSTPDNSSNSYSDVSLGISTDASTPSASVVTVDENNNTNNVLLLVGKIKAGGSSDLVIKEIPVTVSVNGAADADAVATTLKLRINGQEFVKALNTSTASAVVVFNNLNQKISVGTTVTFSILADINDIEVGSFNEGNSISASLTSANVGSIVSNAVVKTGSAFGQVQEFRTAGPQVTLVSTQTDATTGQSANDDVGMFSIKYKVTAVGGDVYIASTTASHIYRVDRNGVPVVSNALSAAVMNNTDTTLTAKGNYLIEEGESETFTLYVSAPLPAVGTSGQYRAALTGIKWDSTDTVVPTKTLTSGFGSFITDYKVLN